MKPIDFGSVKPAGDFERLPPGGYICFITKVTDEPDKERLVIEYDIADGEHRGYYTRLEKNLSFWGGKTIKSYKEAALPFFRSFLDAVIASNPNTFTVEQFSQTGNEQLLAKKYVGIVLGEKEYMGQDKNGYEKQKTRLYAAEFISIDDVRTSKFKVPSLKEYAAPPQPSETYTPGRPGYNGSPDPVPPPAGGSFGGFEEIGGNDALPF
jgi:hypothetical protein